MDSTIKTDSIVENSNNKIEFYCAPIWKVALLTYSTFGFYALFWHYYQWCAQRKAHSLKINPTFRVIFGIFYLPSLSARLKKSIVLNNAKLIWLPKVWAIGLIAFSLILFLGSIATSSHGYSNESLFDKILYYCIVDLLHILFIISFQQTANKLSYPNKKVPNKPFKLFQWVLVFIGVVLRILFFYELTLY